MQARAQQECPLFLPHMTQILNAVREIHPGCVHGYRDLEIPSLGTQHLDPNIQNPS